MASPAAAASAWVQKEVGEWLSLNGGSADRGFKIPNPMYFLP